MVIIVNERHRHGDDFALTGSLGHVLEPLDEFWINHGFVDVGVA
jgi:hypothetical protein